MYRQQSLERARPARRTIVKAQFEGDVTDLIVPDAAVPTPRPQAFLVEQRPRWTLPVHFHQEHQFQVFVGGGGTIGRSAIGPLAVHYASPHSGYGPLVAGDEGISYLTLRAVGDTGAWYLPEQREQLRLRIPKVQAHAAPDARLGAEPLRHLSAPVSETLIEQRDGGLAAWRVRLAPHRQVAAPPGAEHGGGRFLVVTRGSLRDHDDDELPALATAFVSSDETLDLRAGGEGLEVLVLQFPADAAHSFVEAMDRAPR